MTATHRMLSHVQTLLLLCFPQAVGAHSGAHRFYRRLERIEAYLVERFNRDVTSDESPEEKEVFQLIWPRERSD